MRRPGYVRLLAAAALAIGACHGDPAARPWEIIPNMVDSIPYDSFAPNPNTRDGKTLLLPPQGAIPRGFLPFEYGSAPTEYLRAGDELENPSAQTPEVVAQGKKVFETFCYECHGHQGKGDGPVVPPFPTPPSLLGDHACSMVDGKIYYVLTRGQGLMPSYASQVSPDDRWAVIRYIRTLQPAGCGEGD